jgi:MoaA/NifB/PqqE/SkfB family radical SAM enzyme
LKEIFSPPFTGAIRLEACSMCQLKCPICSTGNGKNKNSLIGWGYLKFIDFKNLIDLNTWIKKVELSNWGEIFLNPDLESIVKYAYEKNVLLKAGNGVNLNTAKENILESFVKYNFRTVSVSLDGATDETYRKYRIGGDLNRVIDNIKKINEYKQKYNSEYPKLYWQFVIFGHNEQEIPDARKMAESLGMEFRPKLSWDNSFSPIIDREFVRREGCLKVISREEYNNTFKKQYKIPCTQLWKSPQINWDGKLLGCCVNRYSDFGNIFETGLRKTLSNEKFRYAKKMLIGAALERTDIPCVKCSVYKNIKKYNTFEEIKNKLLEIKE